MAENNIVICSNCGAEFDMHEAKCPFCGHINPLGAEEQYMQKMQDIKSDLAHVDDDQVEEIKKEAKKSVKIVLITLIVIAAVIAVLAIIFAIDKKLSSSRTYGGIKLYEDDLVKAGKWNDENLQLLEDMYAKKDIDGLCAFLGELQASGEYGAFYSWDHSFLVSQIYDMRFWIKYLDENGTKDTLALHGVMFDLLYIYNGDHNGTNMREEDKDILMEEFDVQLKKLSGRYGITKEVLDDMIEKCTPDGYVNPQLVSDYCDEHKEIFE